VPWGFPRLVVGVVEAAPLVNFGPRLGNFSPTTLIHRGSAYTVGSQLCCANTGKEPPIVFVISSSTCSTQLIEEKASECGISGLPAMAPAVALCKRRRLVAAWGREGVGR
jgi:hypothetical protein